MRHLLFTTTVVGAIVLGAANEARAWPYAQQWHLPATGKSPGGNGIYFTGGARDRGLTCALCHVKAPGIIGVTITTTPAWTKVGVADGYRPGATYAVTVTMTGWSKPADQRKNMSLTIEDGNGKTAGVFISDKSGTRSDQCAPAPDPFPAVGTIPGTTYLHGDCHGIISLQQVSPPVWYFSWQAPRKGTGAVTIFYGAVEGNGSGDDSSLNDDVKMGTKKLNEAP